MHAWQFMFFDIELASCVEEDWIVFVFIFIDDVYEQSHAASNPNYIFQCYLIVLIK